MSPKSKSKEMAECNNSGSAKHDNLLETVERKSVNRVQGGEKVLFSRDPDLPGMEVRFSRYDGFSFSRHTHDTYSIGVMLEGASYCIGNFTDSSFVVAVVLGWVVLGETLNPIQSLAAASVLAGVWISQNGGTPDEVAAEV